MSKKNKKNKKKDFWGFSAEDQMENMDRINSILEDESANIFTIGKGKIKTTALPESGFDMDLQRGLDQEYYDKHKTDEDCPEGCVDINDIMTLSNEEESEPVRILEGEDSTRHTNETWVNTMRMAEQDASIRFDIYPDLKRMVVRDNDDLSPTTLSFDAIGLTGNSEFEDQYLDPDFCCDFSTEMFKYVISLMHPTAIFTEDEMTRFVVSKPAGRKSNDSYFIFKKNCSELEETVYMCYLIDDDTLSKFYDYLEAEASGEAYLNNVYISLAYAAGQTHNAFFSETDEYVARFIMSEHNRKLLFISGCDDIDSISDENVTSIEDLSSKLGIIDLEELQRHARESLIDIHEDYDDDEEEDDSDDEEIDNTREILKAMEESSNESSATEEDKEDSEDEEDKEDSEDEEDKEDEELTKAADEIPDVDDIEIAELDAGNIQILDEKAPEVQDITDSMVIPVVHKHN